MLKRLKQAGLIIMLLGISGLIFLAGNDWFITRNAGARLYDRIEQTPESPVALVLGTSKYVNGTLNVYYITRIQAAAALFHAGKIHGILVSGDNATMQYNEPTTMRKDLIALGVPGEYITLDYAGFRTLDSVIRAQKVFGVRHLTIVSQGFHCARALYIADAIGLPAIGYCARDALNGNRLSIRSREILARALAFTDIHIMNRKPKFLGKQEVVRLREQGS
jgi:SanA protein